MGLPTGTRYNAHLRLAPPFAHGDLALGLRRRRQR
jgi:hypothetical protein